MARKIAIVKSTTRIGQYELYEDGKFLGRFTARAAAKKIRFLLGIPDWEDVHD